MGYPKGFAKRLAGQDDVRCIWRWLAERIVDDTGNATNRLAVGGQINVLFHPLSGPFWGRPKTHDIPHLPFTKAVDYQAINLSERRSIERLLPSASPVWQLMGAGSVGSQSLTGLPMIHRLAQRSDCKVWPFDDIDAGLVIAEVYPSIIGASVAAAIAAQTDPRSEVPDQWQVKLLAQAFFALSQADQIGSLFEVPPIAKEEGWILGAGHAAALAAALAGALQ